MAANFKVIQSDSQFQPELSAAGAKLVVVDFYATWCGPCQRISPIFEQFAKKYPKALFLKVDVDMCQDTAASNGVTALPTFLLFRNKARLEVLRGADDRGLEEKIKKWYGGGGDEDDEESLVKGHMDLSTFIDKNGCECLNESNEHNLLSLLTQKSGNLWSDCDEQLLISIAFNQPVKLHSIRINGPPDYAPRVVKLFINQPKTLDFDSADAMTPVQTLILSPSDVEPQVVVPLAFVKFQNVTNVALFVMGNQSGAEVTQISHLTFFGSPVTTTNMADFKRIAGKKGESH